MQSFTLISLAVVLLATFQRGTATDEAGVLEGILKRILEDMIDDQIQVKEIDTSSIKDSIGTTLTKCFGLSSLNGLGRTFRMFDDDKSGWISLKEFNEELGNKLCQISQSEAKKLFKSLDPYGEGLSYNDLAEAFQQPLSEAKKETLVKAFKKADSNKDGVLKLNDEMINRGILNILDADRNREANIQEFADYYNKKYQGRTDVYFDLAMSHVWKLKN
ncbi:unnamed protein product [Owenia fusiformis]|uniref:EF-hand domain-containing protein n=1 Tax=Owenia fusiformis TaxID=6347 RepID=A0A8S4N7C6_OWEFU|nr:unnamed protein product [Owenia fusiformis]